MSVREYVGARYVPIVVGEWDNSKTYEPLMVVTHEGSSYTSRQYVPAGIAITDEKFWVLSANYNAQVEQYRKEVADYKNLADTIEEHLATIYPLDTTPTDDSTKGVTSDGIKKAITTAVNTVTEQFNSLINNSAYSFNVETEAEFNNALEYINSHLNTPSGSFTINITASEIYFTETPIIQSSNPVIIQGNVLVNTTGTFNSISKIGTNAFYVTFNAPTSNINVNDYITIDCSTNSPLLGIFQVVTIGNNTITVKNTAHNDISNYSDSLSYTITKYTAFKTGSNCGMKITNGTNVIINDITFIGIEEPTSSTNYGVLIGANKLDGIIPQSGATAYFTNCCANGYFDGFWCGYSSTAVFNHCFSSNNYGNGYEFDVAASGVFDWTYKTHSVASGNITGVVCTYNSGLWNNQIFTNGNDRGIECNGGYITGNKINAMYNNQGIVAHSNGVISSSSGYGLNNNIQNAVQTYGAIIYGYTNITQYDFNISFNENINPRLQSFSITNYICHVEFTFTGNGNTIPANSILMSNMPTQINAGADPMFQYVPIFNNSTHTIIRGVMNNTFRTLDEINNTNYHTAVFDYKCTMQYAPLVHVS